MRTTAIVAVWGACCLAAIAGVSGSTSAQAELDRIVARVNNRIITQSDVRQARLLRLVDDTSSDDSVCRGLENRMLILAEIARAAPLPPTTDAELSARRAEWESRLGSKPADLLNQAAMSENALQMWLRDDLRIQAHLKRQFGSVPDAERAKATAEWVTRLRQRAGLN